MDRESEFQFLLEFFKLDEPPSLIGRFRLTPDWEPALESIRFQALRRDPGLAAAVAGPGTITPLWDATLGEPYVGSLLAAIAPRGGAPLKTEIPTSYFMATAQQATAGLIQKGRLGPEDTVRYFITAYPSDGDQPDEERFSFAVEPVVQPLPLIEGALDRFVDRATAYDRPDDGDLPVFIPQGIVDEAVAMSRSAGGVETGGILIGRLHRDQGRSEIFAVVTAQIPIRHAEHQLATLTFTPETWSDVSAAITLRRSDELSLGFWHSHPMRHWCEDCPEEKRRQCRLTGEFFSTHDQALFRAVFPRAYSIALVISESYAHGLTWPMFGWRNGLIARRGYFLLDAQTPGPEPISSHTAVLDRPASGGNGRCAAAVSADASRSKETI